jgi:hypothetical protein
MYTSTDSYQSCKLTPLYEVRQASLLTRGKRRCGTIGMLCWVKKKGSGILLEAGQALQFNVWSKIPRALIAGGIRCCQACPPPFGSRWLA